MRFRRITENNTLIPGILGALAFYREEVFAFRVEAEGRRGLRRLMPKGTADILGVVRRGAVGQAFAIETKGTHGLDCGRKACSCSAQRDWRKDWEQRRGLYILTTDVQQAVDAVLGTTDVQQAVDAVLGTTDVQQAVDAVLGRAS